MRRLLVLVALLAVGLGVVRAQVAQLRPVDEAAQQPDFFSFRAQLQRAIARRDVSAVLSAVAPDIKASFGGDNGIDDFRRMWRIGEPESELWSDLGTVLALGGRFSGADTFIAPYTFSNWPQAFDSFEHVVLIAADVRIRTAPRADAPWLGARSFAVLRTPREGSGDMNWTAVQVREGKVGYVASHLVRSPIDYRAFFNKRNGSWKLVTFVAGD